jgi:hypothetical protein
MAKKKGRRNPASQKRISDKIRKVKRDDPGLSNKAAVGKAFGILRNRKSRRGR